MNLSTAQKPISENISSRGMLVQTPMAVVAATEAMASVTAGKMSSLAAQTEDVASIATTGVAACRSMYDVPSVL